MGSKSTLIPSLFDVHHPGPRQHRFFLILSYCCALYFGLISLHYALSSEYIVQDDARQHTFWMLRFLDPSLFPGDLIADYFQSVAPVGYTLIYRIAAGLGIHPFLFNKILPLFLGLITTRYCFGLCLQMLPLPFAGFVVSLLLNQNLWMHDDLASGTPRAFLYPIFTAFLYYLLKQRFLPCMITIALQGWFYPSTVFIMAGLLIVRSLSWQRGLWLSRSRRDALFYGCGLGVAFLVLLPYAVKISEYGPVIAPAVARTLPEFGEFGRSRFFVESAWEFWLTARRSGLLTWVTPLAAVGTLAAPFVLGSKRFALNQQVKHLAFLFQLTFVSLGLFLIAHIVLFTLHLPSRYTHHSLQIFTAFAGGLTVVILLDAFQNWFRKAASVRWLGLAASTLGLGILLLPVPSLFLVSPKLFTGHVQGETTGLYEFLAQQPATTTIASVTPETDDLPVFAGRSILVGREAAVPYHQGYYQQFRQRIQDLIQAQFSSNPQTVVDFIQTYDINFWLLDRAFLMAPPPLEQQVTWWRQLSQGEQVVQTVDDRDKRQKQLAAWLHQFQVTSEPTSQTENVDEEPALAQTVSQCTVFEADHLILLQTDCIRRVLTKL